MRNDTLRHKGLRNQLAQQLSERGIESEPVLEAIRAIPRHLFLDKTLEAHAYEDRAFPIGAEQTISHPYTVAFQTELLEVRSGMKVLEIGTGSGYQSAVLSFLGAEVYTIERQLELFRKAEVFFRTFRWKPKLIHSLLRHPLLRFLTWHPSPRSLRQSQPFQVLFLRKPCIHEY